MIQPPQDKCPVGPMPESRKKENNDFIQAGSRPALPISAQRDIQILFKPCRQRDVPSPPKFPDACRSVRVHKILPEMKSEHPAQPDSHITVSAEIIINLQ